LTRKDAVIALGGGVVGDLAGFCAASYMRGIAFVNIPTTLLAQVDSSVGGKTAVDLGHLKNIVGAFWQPETVIIDPDVLITLPEEQLKAGLAEALKMGLIFDEALVEAFEAEDLDLDYIITRSIDLKRQIVEQDEREAGCRALLNFGHTIGHAIEAATGTLHGLCVAAGMLYFIEDEPLKNRVKTIYERLGIEPEIKADKDVLMDCLLHDKKSQGKTIQTVHVKEAGKGYLQSMTPADIEKRLA
jgi:3-dehydroquinate synthase